MFAKCRNIEFHENPFIESRTVPCGEEDGRDEAK